MTDNTAYDSRADTLEHIGQVRDRIDVFVAEMLRRGSSHDASKLVEPEKPAFDQILPLLAGVAYASPEYRALEERFRPTLEHHFAHNSHHPEHYGNQGIGGMDLFDLAEMICDWMAAALRHPQDGVNLVHNIKLFGIEPQLAGILANTLARWPNPQAP